LPRWFMRKKTTLASAIPGDNSFAFGTPSRRASD
jgi:hypothetical protein